MSVPTGFEPLPVQSDPDVVTTEILTGLQLALGPEWRVGEGAPEVALAEEIGRTTASVAARVADAFAAAFAGFGVSVHGLPAITGVAARVAVSVTVTAAGAVVPAGLLVTGTTASGQVVAFRLLQAVTAATTTVAATLVAEAIGTGSNGVPTGPLTVITSTATVVSITATAASSGGVDPETRPGYLDRLVPFLGVLRPGAVRGEHAAVLARNTPGVQRALAVDTFDAQTNTAGVERTVSVYPLNAAGDDVPAETATALRVSLESTREVNFVFRVANATRTAVAVTFTAVAKTGQDPAVVRAGIIAAITEYLSPARWGAPPPPPGSSALATTWEATPVVRYFELSRIASSAPGVGYLTGLQVNGTAADVTLPGRAALPARVGTATGQSTVSGTVT